MREFRGAAIAEAVEAARYRQAEEGIAMTPKPEKATTSPESQDAPADDLARPSFDELWDAAVPVEETLERLRARIDAAS